MTGDTTTLALVTGPGGTALAVEFILDSGVKYSVVPDNVWRHLGLVPRRPFKLDLADGTLLTRELSDCDFRIGEVDGPSPVILGLPSDAALLGEVTLSTVGLVFDPLTRNIRPMTMRL